MRFGWQVRAQDRRTRIGAVIVATALTVGAVTTLSGRFEMSLAALRGSVAERVARTYERIVFVTPVSPRRATGVAVSRPRPAVPNEPVSASPSAAPDTGSRRAPEASALPLGLRGPAASADPTWKAFGPALAPSALTTPSRTMTLSAAQQDSILAEFAKDFVRRAMMLKPTPAQRDSIGREQARIYARARDEMRPVPIPLGGSSIGVSLFGRGPSREQRKRDSIVHQDNLQRLERLALRVRWKADSTRRADSIASRKVIATDSMDE
jgi:hypothetical protein